MTTLSKLDLFVDPRFGFLGAGGRRNGGGETSGGRRGRRRDIWVCEAIRHSRSGRGVSVEVVEDQRGLDGDVDAPPAFGDGNALEA